MSATLFLVGTLLAMGMSFRSLTCSADGERAPCAFRERRWIRTQEVRFERSQLSRVDLTPYLLRPSKGAPKEYARVTLSVGGRALLFCDEPIARSRSYHQAIRTFLEDGRRGLEVTVFPFWGAAIGCVLSLVLLAYLGWLLWPMLGVYEIEMGTSTAASTHRVLGLGGLVSHVVEIPRPVRHVTVDWVARKRYTRGGSYIVHHGRPALVLDDGARVPLAARAVPGYRVHKRAVADLGQSIGCPVVEDAETDALVQGQSIAGRHAWGLYWAAVPTGWLLGTAVAGVVLLAAGVLRMDGSPALPMLVGGIPGLLLGVAAVWRLQRDAR